MSIHVTNLLAFIKRLDITQIRDDSIRQSTFFEDLLSGGGAVKATALLVKGILLAGLKSGDDLVTIFRAVGPGELADIQKSGAFQNILGLEGKYFTTSAEGAANYARQAVAGFGDAPYTIVSTRVPQSVLSQPGIHAMVDGGIPAFVVPNRYLPGLTPTVLNFSPLP